MARSIQFGSVCTASSSAHVGIGMDAYSNGITLHGNTLEGFYYGVRTITGSGPALYGLFDNFFRNSVAADVLTGVVSAGERLWHTATQTWNISSMTIGGNVVVGILRRYP